MSNLGFELLFRFMWGSVVLLTIISRKETTERFPRIAAWIIAGVGFFAIWLASKANFPRTQTLPGIVALVGGEFLYAWGRSRLARIAGFAFYLAAPIFFLADRPWGQSLNFLVSGLLFGAVFVGQYLGHWFLTVPGLHINELKRVVSALFGALALRTLVVTYTLFVTVGMNARFNVDTMGRPIPLDAGNTASLPGMSSAASLLSMHGDSWFGLGFFGMLILATRLLWGIVAPWLLAYMIKETVKTRSTQSATGILYALSVMILLGEGAALYLQNTLGWLL